MKGFTKVQWINLNWNNRSVLASRYSVVGEKTSPILLPLVGLTAGGKREAGRPAGQQTKCRWVLKFLKFSTG